MADKTITDFTEGMVQGTDVLVGVDVNDTTGSADGTTKKYVRSNVFNYYLDALGLETYEAVRVASTVSLTATYDNGVLGVGATLTNSGAQAELELDSITLNAGDRVLIDNQVNQAHNGIYIVTDVGSDASNWILTRATDFDEASEILQYAVVLVDEGDTQAGILYQQKSPAPFIIGTSPITFLPFTVQSISYPVSLADGGTGASLTANNGGVVYSTATTLAILNNPGVTGKFLQSVNAGAPIWSSAAFPTSPGSAGKLLRSDGTNWVLTTTVEIDASDGMTGLTNLTVDNININGNTITATDLDGNITLVPNSTGNLDVFTPPPSESGSININGFDFDLAFRVNDFGINAPAQVIIHRHSTAIEANLVGVRSNDDTDAHAPVVADMALLSIIAGGWTGNQYSLFGQIKFSADSTGTIDDTSAPGKIELMVTPDSSINPETAVTISNDKTVTFAADIDAGLTDGQLLIGETGTVAAKATLTAGTGISITNGAGSITIDAVAAGLSWQTDATGTIAAAVNNGYICGNAGATTITLPATAAIGSIVSVEGLGAGGWILTANTGQTIQIGGAVTSSGGTLTSAAATDNVQVVCIVADTTWRVQHTNSTGLTVA